MVLNEDMCEQTNKEEIDNVYGWLLDFFLLNIHYDNIPVEQFKENIKTGVLFKTLEEEKQWLINKQEKRKDNFKDMVLDAFFNGESRKMTFVKTREADYILELNLIRSTDKKIEDYYKEPGSLE